MPQELNLDALANEMRNQQGMGQSAPKTLSWNPKTMKLESASKFENVPSDRTLNQGVTNTGWFTY